MDFGEVTGLSRVKSQSQSSRHGNVRHLWPEDYAFQTREGLYKLMAQHRNHTPLTPTHTHTQKENYSRSHSEPSSSNRTMMATAALLFTPILKIMSSLPVCVPSFNSSASHMGPCPLALPATTITPLSDPCLWPPPFSFQIPHALLLSPKGKFPQSWEKPHPVLISSPAVFFCHTLTAPRPLSFFFVSACGLFLDSRPIALLCWSCQPFVVLLNLRVQRSVVCSQELIKQRQRSVWQ